MQSTKTTGTRNCRVHYKPKLSVCHSLANAGLRRVSTSRQSPEDTRQTVCVCVCIYMDHSLTAQWRQIAPRLTRHPQVRLDGRTIQHSGSQSVTDPLS
mmetsp:Transcript_40895/g.102172  ORF Transcript_40895/g.102172 Transcript_40895/m.102172 type:complete len:98 (+) Transcript_40895:90-383(+)